MKKIKRLFIAIFCLFISNLITKATSQYQLREIPLSSSEVTINDNFPLERFKLNDGKIGFTAVGNSYQCGESTCNVYNISMTGVITKANLKYDKDTEFVYNESSDLIEAYYIYNYYNYIDIDDNHHLVRRSRKNIGYYNPNVIDPSTISHETVTTIDDTLYYQQIYCDSMENYTILGYRQLEDMSINRMCLLIAKDIYNNQYYGLVKEGPDAEVVVTPSVNYNAIIMFPDEEEDYYFSDRLKVNDTTYKFSYFNGTTEEISLNDFNNKTVDDIYTIGDSKEGLIYGIYYDNQTAISTNSRLIGNFNSSLWALEVYTLKNGEFFIEAPSNTSGNKKLYNSDGQVIANATYTNSIHTGDAVISYINDDNNVVFTDGKSILYSIENTNNKYDYLFSYLDELNGIYFFRSGTDNQGKPGNYLYILSPNFKGDWDNSGNVDLTDVLNYRRYISGLEEREFTEEELSNLDFNEDGEINLVDLVNIRIMIGNMLI